MQCQLELEMTHLNIHLSGSGLADCDLVPIEPGPVFLKQKVPGFSPK